MKPSVKRATTFTTQLFWGLDIEKHPSTALRDYHWNFTELEKYKKVIDKEANFRKASGIPFAVSLTALIRVKKY